MSIVKLPNKAEFIGVSGLTNPFISSVSASRSAMAAHHSSQAVTPNESNIPHILTGFENQLTSFSVTVPFDAIVISVHRKYRRGLDKHAIKENPTTTIIIQDQLTGVYDSLTVNTYFSKHRTYGSRNIINPIIDRLRPGNELPKGTILSRSPNVKENNIFSNSVSANVISLSIPSTIEDGFCVSESFCERAGLTEINETIVIWGKTKFALNLYGTDEHYKPFPDIGDTIRADGLILALREYNPLYDATTMTNRSLQKIDFIHDTRFYSTPGATVFDITVESGIGESKQKPVTPMLMGIQPERYISTLRDYYNSILDSYHTNICKDRTPRLSPRLISLIYKALGDMPNAPKIKGSKSNGIIRRTYKKVPLDEYRVQIKVSKKVRLAPGSKITGNGMGSKGVICQILPDYKMPVDKDGNRADIVKFARSEIARLNPGQKYTQFINAASRDMGKWIKNEYIVNQHSKCPDYIWDRLLAFYQAASTINYKFALKQTEQNKEHHIKSILEDGIYLIIPPDDPLLGKEIFTNIMNVIQPTYDVVTYYDILGRKIVTKDKAFIGVEEIIVLEKSDLHPTAISTGYIQHHGLLAGPNKSGRNGHPSKCQATKVFSETEIRLFLALLGFIATCNQVAFSNSPEAHKSVIRAVIRSFTPSNLKEYIPVDRLLSRPLKIISHGLLGFGLIIKKVIKKLI